MHVHGSPSPAADEFPMNCDIVVTPRVGRTTGYVAATVIDDPRAGEECDQSKPGIVCGAGVEQWPDAAAAQKRADYLKSVLSAAPILGTEYATLRGNLLLQVSGKLTPFVADQYKAAFTA